MKIAAGHELKHKAAMSKVGDVEVGIPGVALEFYFKQQVKINSEES